jgi:hypothetical protein
VVTLFILAVLGAKPVDVNDAIGFVLTIKGNWQVDGDSTKVEAGDRLRPGVKISPVPDQIKPSIKIAYYTGKCIECDASIITPHMPQEPSLFERLVTGAAKHYAYTYATAQSRIPCMFMLPDIAIDKEGSKINVRPLMTGISGGSYTLTFLPFDPMQTIIGSNDGTSIDVEWQPKPDAPSLINFPGLTYGLYTVTGRGVNSLGDVCVLSEGWVLIAPSDRLKSNADTLSDARGFVARRDSNISPAEGQRFVRAVMCSLAEKAK